MDLIEGQVPPEELVSCQYHIDQLLDTAKCLLAADDITHAEGTIIQVPTEFIALGCQVVLETGEAQSLVEVQIPFL